MGEHPQAPVCDVLVVGGGATGPYLAALLAQQGVDVVVLERRSAPQDHSRAIGLHPPGVRALQAVGVGEAALAEGTRIGAGTARSRGRQLGRLTFERAWPHLPFVLSLPQQRTEALLERRLARLAPAALQRGWEVVAVHEEAGLVHVRAERTARDGSPAGTRTWRARVLVGADGAHSRVRELAGVTTRLHPYPDTYLMGDFADGTGDGTTAAIHLEPGGVVESFPLPGGVRRWVAHTGSGLREACPRALAALVEQRTGHAPDPASATMVSAFAVRRRLVRRMVTGRQVLIGDAAHEISPIGGQGMTLGWLDALALAPLLVRAVGEDGGDDPGRPLRSLPGFRRFERTRRRAAVAAARCAELNMSLGRPGAGARRGARDVLVRALLSTPLRHLLAGTATMRWARPVG